MHFYDDFRFAVPGKGEAGCLDLISLASLIKLRKPAPGLRRLCPSDSSYTSYQSDPNFNFPTINYEDAAPSASPPREQTRGGHVGRGRSGRRGASSLIVCRLPCARGCLTPHAWRVGNVGRRLEFQSLVALGHLTTFQAPPASHRGHRFSGITGGRCLGYLRAHV